MYCKKNKYLSRKSALMKKKFLENKYNKKLSIYKCKCWYFHFTSKNYLDKIFFRIKMLELNFLYDKLDFNRDIYLNFKDLNKIKNKIKKLEKILNLK